MSRPAALLITLFAVAPAHAGDWLRPTEGTLADHWETGELGRWTLEDGVLSQPNNPETKTWKNYDRYVRLKGLEAKDFEAVFEWRCEENSGFYFHTHWDGEGAPRKAEVQIYDSYGTTYLQRRAEKKGGTPPGDDVLHNHDAGGLVPGPPPSVNACKPSGEWNEFRIVCRDGRVTVELNGTTVQDLVIAESQVGNRTDSTIPGGFAFQDHGWAVEIRNLKIRSLDD